MINDINFTIYLVRHAEAQANYNYIVSDSPNIKLTKLGIKQTKFLKSRFSNKQIYKVYSSPFERAKTTAESSFPDHKVNIFEELTEYNAGDWKGQERKLVYTEDIQAKVNSLGKFFKFPNGESYSQVEHRMSGWLEKHVLYSGFVSSESRLNNVNIVVVSHAIALKCMIRYVMNYNDDFIINQRLDNTGVTKMTFNSNTGWKMIYINDSSHLGF
jgi:broad specificity phosphatase PhoE